MFAKLSVFPLLMPGALFSGKDRGARPFCVPFVAKNMRPLPQQDAKLRFMIVGALEALRQKRTREENLVPSGTMGNPTLVAAPFFNQPQHRINQSPNTTHRPPKLFLCQQMPHLEDGFVQLGYKHGPPKTRNSAAMGFLPIKRITYTLIFL